MLNQLEKIKKEYEKVSRKLENPEIVSNLKISKKYFIRQAELKELIDKFEKYQEADKEISEIKALIREEQNLEMIKMAENELAKLEKEKKSLEKEIQISLLPQDPNDKKNVIMEIRAGTGGEEAALFASDLYRMYIRYAEKKGWRTKLISSNRTSLGGFKEIIIGFEGNNIYQDLKYESGVHRVQRIPETEKLGRIHTSTATVAVLPEVEEVDIKIDPKDLKIDTFRSSGAGGQHVNVTDSAVRITHLPTQIVVSCQNERSQLKNRERAMKVLRSRIFDSQQEKQRKERGEARKIQIGSGERSEKIRTYNFPQNRITDHRIKFTSKNLFNVLEGNLDELINKLKEENKKKLLEKLASK